jgi:putative DNA primase/helicase
MKIAIGNSRKDRIWRNMELSWAEFLQRVSQTTRTAETVEEYMKLPRAQKDEIKDVGGFVGGHLKNGRRKTENVESRSMLTMDMDYAVPGVWETITMLYNVACCIYSTHKHTPEKPRLRLIIPLSRNVTPEEYIAVARMVAADIGIEQFDDTTYQPHRLMYWPSTSADGEFIFESQEGRMLDPDTVLKRYTDWRDSSQWPVSSRQKAMVRRNITRQADPLEKPGVVGAFCRAYSIEDAIDKFIPDVYSPSLVSERYDYLPADSSAGVLIYDDKFAYSHHATDPACQKLCNAFDLVRIHKFGELDDNADESTETSKLPSYKAMQEFAITDEGVRTQLAEERMEQAEADFGEGEWQTSLELDKHGKVRDTLTNITTIIRHDEKLKPIVFNQLKSMLDVVGELPWKQVKPGWGDADLACAKIYFERVYGIWSPTKFKDALLGVISAERLHHPIKEYFETLQWDGVPRIETLLVDYLGAEDTVYVRAVTRKTLVAAVARVYEPGIKFDSILVLSGTQGIGKSTLFQRLGGKWYSDSLSISDMKDKTAAEKLQGYWILELGELAGIKKMDVETVKSFITRTDDKFRQSYGIAVESHPRSCIIVGSTNSNDGFLRDITGNRRFWPVRVNGRGKHQPWELEEVDQIWAEAIAIYQKGEHLFLKDQEAAEANVQQQLAMETDDREGVISEYLDQLLPDEWDKMDLYQRRSFLSGSEFSGERPEGTNVRDRVCIIEIWCECLCKERQNIRKADSYELEAILQKIGGWKRYDGSPSGKLRIPGYGPQRAFVRVSQGGTGNIKSVAQGF